jgi:hypothetical protein
MGIDRAEMNIFELTLLLGFLWVGYVCGKILGAYLGVTGWIVGFVLGCAVAVGAYTIFLRFIDFWRRVNW